MAQEPLSTSPVFQKQAAGVHDSTAVGNDDVPAIAQTLSTDTTEGLEALHDFESGDTTNPLNFTSISDPKESSKAKSKSVAPRRKEELLLQARSDRLHWIQQAPLPYRKERSDATKHNTSWENANSLQLLSRSHVIAQAPSVIGALEHLYGETDPNPDSVLKLDQRVYSLLDLDYKEKAIPRGFEILSKELAEKQDDAALIAYHSFLSHLQNPACAMIVQGMRRFCRKVGAAGDSATLGKMLLAYVDSTLSALQSNVAYKGEDLEQLQVRRSLESCLYAHCSPCIDSFLWNDQAQTEDDAWLEKLDALQFVTPSHLEIACLEDDFNTLEGEGLASLLQAPIRALLSVDQYYSPFEKLECVLAMYRGVNAALNEALNRHKSTHDGAPPRKLPSADDVLPTTMLVLLNSRPKRLLMNLYIMEEWSPAEYIRGEAGYAYTNLYGAVQFLRNIDLGAEPSKLRISTEDLKRGMETCRAAAEQKIQAKSAETTVTKPCPDEPPPPRVLQPSQVRLARSRGENPGVEWALNLMQQQKQSNETTNNSVAATKQKSAFDEAIEGLPSNFTRHYSFLNSTADDVKLSDIPDLLAEYRVLVHTVERLIGDKTARIKSNRKAAAVVAEEDLFARVRTLDPSLLPDEPTAAQP